MYTYTSSEYILFHSFFHPQLCCLFPEGPFPLRGHTFLLDPSSITSPMPLCVINLVIFGVKWRAPPDSTKPRITWSHAFSLLAEFSEKTWVLPVVGAASTIARGWPPVSLLFSISVSPFSSEASKRMPFSGLDLTWSLDFCYFSIIGSVQRDSMTRTLCSQ